MRLWLVVLGAAVGTYALRVSFVTLFGRLDEVPPRVKRTLAFVPPAVLAALVVPELVLDGEALAISLSNHRLLAGLVAAVAAWYTEDMLVTVVVGMSALYALSLVP
ncbi:AzlD domain-containing protein [Halobacterium litoreum]|uniref:AzlD domain-containing protein n=1 Tax=Halobacterium litoreum TaxID=2039234 RepID=A0ABD5NHT3_9EURY|nr:AzlD domain-containing protein [Halobacterium litoreum]UHH12302.1 AzlD domain-containing protein [Halobacterium litoreum]